MRPALTNGYFDRYIQLVEGDSLEQFMVEKLPALHQFYMTLREADPTYAYAQGKWEVATLIQHMIDTERIFAYRLLSIARGERQSLPGFEEKDYAAASDAINRDMDDLLNEFFCVRDSTDLLMNSIPVTAWNNEGTANGSTTTPLAIAFVIYGHLIHHKSIIEERYLPAALTTLENSY